MRLTKIKRFLLDALERMREPDADSASPTGKTRSGWESGVGARFAPFFVWVPRQRWQLKIDRFFVWNRRRWALTVAIGGALLLAYVCGQYLSMWHEQHVFAQEWSRQASVAAPVSAPIVVDGESGIARLTIPKLDMHAIVIEGTSYGALKAGPGHLVQTPLPGDEGNSVLAGHRDTFFRGLDDLVAGDSIVIERQGRTYRFAVAGRKIVEPGDVSVLDSSAEPKLTLITCYPPHVIGPAPKRLVILGELAETQQQGVQGH